MKLAIHGATGRMGRAVARLALEDDGIQLVGAIAAVGDPSLGKDLGELAGVGSAGVEVSSDVSAGLLGADVVIDFSVAGAVGPLLRACEKAKVALVSGTTNLDEETQAALARLSESVAVVWAPNMSRGVQVLAEVVQYALRRLGSDFDVEIVEVHHRRKLDSPSGTAVRLAEAAHSVRPELTELRGRDGQVGARTNEEMGVFGVRGGDVIGDHTVHLLGASERLELTHRATDRDLFARGALSAAHFAEKRAPGRYTIADVLGAG
jgi:4-hydroxy-tetrahydrodipicolinate reductase